MLKFEHQYSYSYYPQGNGQVEAVNKFIKIMLQRMVGNHKTNWHHMLFSSLWAYHTFAKTTTSFTLPSTRHWINTPYRVSDPITLARCGTPSWYFTFGRTTPPTWANHRIPPSFPPSHQSNEKHGQRPIMTPMSTLAPLAKAIWFWSMTNPMRSWENPSSSQCGMVHMWSTVALKKNPRNGLYLKIFYA